MPGGDHQTLRVIHQTCALLSIVGFAWRGGLMLAGSSMLTHRWMRRWPHLIDTLLLLSGVWMVFDLHLHPGNSPWLAAKLAALLIYIALGFVALRLGKTYRVRAAAFVAAISCFAFIVAVAVTRTPWPW
ncbi:MAG: SirB2 family protein [Chromatiaceae bacterium]|nr:SirB2 family protein [Chromatiaceae bacterium]MCP5312654.1 SirB2 family protein [Chromatiaceae bacterium]